MQGDGIPRYAKVVALTKENHVQGLTATIDIMTGQRFGESSSIWNVTDTGSHLGSDDLKDWEGNKDKDNESSEGGLISPSGFFLGLIILNIIWNGL